MIVHKVFLDFFNILSTNLLTQILTKTHLEVEVETNHKALVKFFNQKQS